MPKNGYLSEQKDEVLILTNGRESEQNYFNLIKAKYKSPYKITVKFLNGSPDYLARHATEIINSYNKIYIVSDVDAFEKSIELSYSYLKKYKNKIFLILSNISFEVWLINHYKEFNLNKNINELKAELNKYLKDNGCKGEYNKSDSVILEKYFIFNALIASKNAKIAFQKLFKEYILVNNRQPNNLELRSSTTIYRLIEDLHLEIKKN